MLLVLPRIGLASDDELEHLSAVYSDGGPKAMQALLNLMDSGVEDCVIWSAGGGHADFMSSVTGKNGDKLDLMEPIPMPPTAGCTLLHSEGTLEVALNQLTLSVDKMINDTMESKKPIDVLAAESPRQVCLLVQRVRFTQDVEKCLRDRRDLGRLLTTHAETKSKICARLLSREASAGERATLQALQIVLCEQANIVTKLLAEKTLEESGKLWLDQVRFYHDANDKSIPPSTEVRTSEKTLRIGSAYSPPDMLVTTEFTHTLRWAYMDTMCEGGLRMLALVGRTGSGKTAMLRNVGELLGTLPTTIRASEEMPSDEKFWRRKFLAARGPVTATTISSLAPVIVSQAQRLSTSTLNVVIEVARELEVALCLTMIPGPDAAALQEGILAGQCTQINVPEADLKVIAAGQLAAEGLTNSDALGEPLARILESLNQECTQQSHYDFGPRTLVQICTQIGAGRLGCVKGVDEIETVREVLRRCLLPRLVKADVPVLQRLLGEHLSYNKELASPSTAKAGRWPTVVEEILSITTVEPDCVVLPVPPNDEETFFGDFCRTLNKIGHTLVDGLAGKTLAELSPGDLLGKMPKKGEALQDGLLIKALRQAMDDHPCEVAGLATTVWVKMMTGNCPPEKWECLFELMNDSGCINLATGEQLRLAPNLRFLFVMPCAGDTPPDTFSRTAVVWTDPDNV